MPNWKRVILSGSNAHLNEITASGDISGSALSTLHGFGSITASKFGDKGSNYTGSFSGDGSNLIGVSSETVNITEENSEDASRFLTFVDGAGNNRTVKADGGLVYNPSLNLITNASASNAETASRVNVIADNSSNANRFLTFIDGATPNTLIKADGGLTYNPSLNLITNASASNAETASRINVLDETTGVDADRFISFTDGGGANRLMRVDGGFTYNPGLNLITNASASYAETASRVNVVTDNSSDANRFLTFVDGGGANSLIKADGGLTYNPGLNLITNASASYAETASRINVLDETTGVDANRFVMFTDGSGANRLPRVDGGFTYNPTLNIITNASASYAETASRVNVVEENSVDASRFLTFVDGGGANKLIKADGGLTYNPSTNILSTTVTTAHTASKVNYSTNANVDATYFLTFVPAGAQRGLEVEAGLSYNPSTNILSTTVTNTQTASRVDVETVSDNRDDDLYIPFATKFQGNNLGLGLEYPLTYNPSTNVIGRPGGGVAIASAQTSSKVLVTQNESANETVYITFVDGTSGQQSIEVDTGLSYNPSTNMISADFAASASLAERITDATGSVNALSSSFQDRLGVSVEDGIAYADSSNRLRNNSHVTLIDSNNTSNAVLAIGGQGTTGNSRLHLHASGSSNYFIGGIGRAAIGAQYNLMVGDVAHVVDGDDNVMVGVRGPSEQRNNTSYATTLGSTVMQNAKQIHATEGIGFGAGKYMVSASENTIIGAQAGLNLDGGARVTQVGHPYYDINAYNDIPDGEASTYFRDRARYNTFIGHYAGAYFDKTRTHTATIGAGSSTATLFRSGSNNVIIGRFSKPGAGYTQFETVIGAQTIGHGPYTSTIGSGSLYVSSQGDGNVYAGIFTGSAVNVGHISGSRVSASNIVGTNLISDSGSFSSRTQTLETTMTAEQTNIDNLEAKVGQSLNTSDSPTFAGLTVQGKLTAEVYAVSSSVTHMTRSFSSGSTIFGDDSDDTHQVTGSLLVTGSFLVREGDISGSRISASNIVGTNLISDSGSFSTRTQTLETTMVSEQTNIDNLQTDSGSFSTRVTQATSSIASATASIASLVTTLTSEQSNIDDLETKVGQSLNTSDSPSFAGLTVDGNISASGDVIAQNYIVRSTVTTITSSFSSGSTIFGDDQQDTHKFTGSLLVTGSLNIVGNGIISGSRISASNIVGTNLISDSGSFSTRITDATASINAISTSMSSRLASSEAGAITGIDTDAGVGLSGGTTSGTATLSVNFGDTTLQTAISGAFTQPSSSISTRITTIQGTGTIQGLGTTNRVLFSEITSSGNVSGSGTATASFGRFEGDGRGLTNVAASSIAYTNITGAPSQSLSLRVTQATASIAAATASINSISSSFSTRITGINSGSISTRLTTESTNIDNLQTDSGSFSTRVTQATSSISAITSSIDSLVSKVGQSLNTSDSPTFAGMTINGDLLAQRYIVSSSVTHITSSFSSGSTIFGDTIDDTHKFTGSLFVSGSNNKITGSLSVSGSVTGKTLILDGGTFTSASLASGGGGVFADIDGSNSRASRNLQVTGSMNISSSLTVKPTDSGSTAIHTTNINAGYPTANRWQDNLDGSYFNNFDHNTNVSEILRFMAGIISHSIDTASPTANTKTYGSVTPSYTDGTHSSKDTILNGVLGSSYEDGRLSKAWTGSAYIDMSETGSYKLALNYLQHKGWVQSSDRGTNSDDVGTNPFHGSYASRIPSPITTQGTYATLTHTLSATAGGSSGVFSNSNHFGLGGLTSGGATEFKVRVMATQSFSDSYADTTPDENSTFTRNAVSTLTHNSFGTSNGLTIAKINSANPAVIPAAFQDGIFSSVAGALSGRQNHGGSTTSTNISASGYYAIHGVKAGIATGSGNFSFQDGVSSTTRFYLYTGGITTDITDGAPTGAALGVTGSFIKTKNSCVSRSFSGAPYVASLQVNYTIAAECTKSFDPVYNSKNTARTPLRIYLSTEAAPSPMSTTLSTATVLIDSDGVATAVTSGLKRGVFDRTKTTQRSDGDIPNISDMCIVSASYSQSIAAGGNATDITKIVGNLSEQRYSRTFGYQGRNWQGSNSTVTDPANAQRFVLNSGTFGQAASSGSLAVYTRTQGTDPTAIGSTTEAFLGEDHRRRISNGLLGNTQDVFTTDQYATVDRKTAIDAQLGYTSQVPCMPGSYDLQVKPGYLVDPGSDYRYWFPSGYNSSQTYKYYIRTFETDGGTKSSMTVRLRNEGDGGGGTTLQNWNSTGAGYACAILFESSTTAGNNTSFSTARLYDVADQSNNVIETGVSADNFKNPFTDDIDLYGSKDGSTSSGTYTVPLRNADGMFLDASDNQLHLIIRHKAASSSNPEPLTSIIVSFS